ncbi:MAG: hypothetical protein RID53_16685 [Coleofasciculus sp. B1-GNL1-01]|uniref:hypothetical protein n=1 Tax=Coleofasciculus sp. B1-GNL1-01 TaxID=3068484 RepID=UPI0032FC0E05
MQLTEHLSPRAAQAFIEALPVPIRDALLAYSAEIEYPVEGVLEMAIAMFLDLDCAGFADCRTDTPSMMRERIAILEAVIRKNGLTVPELPE